MKPSDTQPTPESYRGMTVNERLMASGLLNEFDATVRRRDRSAMILLLARVKFEESQAVSTTDMILANPEHYGY